MIQFIDPVLSHDIEGFLFRSAEGRSDQFKGKAAHRPPLKSEGSQVGVEAVHLLSLVIDLQVQGQVLGTEFRGPCMGDELVFAGRIIGKEGDFKVAGELVG